MNPCSEGGLADPGGSKEAEEEGGRWVILVR